MFQQVRRSEIGDVVILDADANTVETPFDDLNSLPQEVVSTINSQLRIYYFFGFKSVLDTLVLNKMY